VPALLPALLSASLFASRAGAQTLSASVSTLPPTGVDFSGVDAFYRIAGIITKGGEPSLELWQELFETPGYQLVSQQNPVIRQAFMTALSPSHKGERDAILATDSDAALSVRHLMRAWEMRQQVLVTRDVLARTIRDSVAKSLARAEAFLPNGYATRDPPPFVAFAVFGYDGYSVDGGVLLDPLYVREQGLVGLLAHEFHHAFTATLDRTIRPQFGEQPPPDASLVMPLIHLRNEGIADLIDKTYPLPAQAGPLAWYSVRYNDFYARSPQILKSIDSMLAVISVDPQQTLPSAIKVSNLLWSNSHPTGAYMARTIYETFGTDSLLPGLTNPFAFLRAFSSAEVRRGRPPTWSRQSLDVIADMERRYVR
jgi:hypothetical protein